MNVSFIGGYELSLSVSLSLSAIVSLVMAVVRKVFSLDLNEVESRCPSFKPSICRVDTHSPSPAHRRLCAFDCASRSAIRNASRHNPTGLTRVEYEVLALASNHTIYLVSCYSRSRMLVPGLRHSLRRFFVTYSNAKYSFRIRLIISGRPGLSGCRLIHASRAASCSGSRRTIIGVAYVGGLPNLRAFFF